MKKRNSKHFQPLAYIPYLLLRLVHLCYDLVPAHKAYAMGFSFTAALYPFFRKRRQIAINNIIQAGITDSQQEADRIARHAFGHLAGHLCEALKVNQVITPENWRDHIVFDGPDESWKLLLDTPETPVLILTGHHGVWEAAAPVISFSRPMIAVARKMNNPYIEKYMQEKHLRGDVTIVPKNMGFTSATIKEWQNRKAAMTLLMDQHAGQRYGAKIPFMGRSAYTHTSPARLHIITGAPILVGSFVREAPMQYRMITNEPIYYTPQTDRQQHINSLLHQVNERLGALVKRYPEQYLWAHKRWR